MKDISNHKNDIEQWIERITTPQKSGHPICPFAKKAKYWIYPYEDMLSLQLRAGFYDHRFDLFICLPTDQYMTVEQAKYLESNCNRHAKDSITLLDHPDDPGYIDDICTSNGKYVIFLIQSKKGLLDARSLLRKSNYYNNWSDDYYKKIVGTNNDTLPLG